MGEAESVVRRSAEVCVTGLGVLCSAGAGIPALLGALRAGSTSIAPLDLFDTSDLSVHVAGQVRTVPTSSGLSGRDWARASRADRMTIVALEESLRQSRLNLAEEEASRVGVAVGTSMGAMFELETYLERRRTGARLGDVRAKVATYGVGSPAALVARVTGAAGRRLAPSTACSSSAVSLAMGAAWIRSGAADVVLAGGVDALARTTFAGFHCLRALSPEPCRPFDADRSGMSLGEGAGMLVLESADHARRRGADVLATLAGTAMTCDGFHPTAPHGDGEGAARAMRGALRDAARTADSVDYVNAHGTGTQQNDAAESAALRQVFGTRAVPVSSTKGLVGHLLGGAGALEAIISVLALREQILPGNFNLGTPDSAGPPGLLQRNTATTSLRTVLSNSYGFGGNNASLLFVGTRT